MPDQLGAVAEHMAVSLPQCPHCHKTMVRGWIEATDGSGWFCAWLCDCKRKAS